MLRKIVQILILTGLFSTISFAQEEINETINQESASARKIHEFGRTGECELGAIIDSFLIELNEDASAKGYIIFYKGKDFLPAYFDSNPNEKRVRNYIFLRKFDQSRIVFVDGGFREEMSNELWLVPQGAVAPKPSRTVKKPTLPKTKTYLYDNSHVGGYSEDSEDYLAEFILPSVKAEIEEQKRLDEEEWKRENPDLADSAAEETQEQAAENQEESINEASETEQQSPADIDEIKFSWAKAKFGEVIGKQKGATGVIIFYADDAYYDVNKLQGFIEEGRNRIAAEAKISPEKIQVIFGGYHNAVKADFWIVPKKGELPIATPEQREAESE